MHCWLQNQWRILDLSGTAWSETMLHLQRSKICRKIFWQREKSCIWGKTESSVMMKSMRPTFCKKSELGITLSPWVGVEQHVLANVGYWCYWHFPFTITGDCQIYEGPKLTNRSNDNNCLVHKDSNSACVNPPHTQETNHAKHFTAQQHSRKRSSANQDVCFDTAWASLISNYSAFLCLFCWESKATWRRNLVICRTWSRRLNQDATLKWR